MNPQAMMTLILRRHKRNARELCEPDMTDNQLNFRHIAVILALLALLGGCAPVNLKPGQTETAEQALAVAGNMGNALEAQRYLLKTADRFQNTGHQEAARTLLQSKALTPPAAELTDQYRLLAMAGAVDLQDGPWADRLAASMSVNQFEQYRPDLLVRAANLQAQTYSLAQQPLNAALTWIALGQKRSDTDRTVLNDQIWQALKRTDDQTLQKQAEKAIGYETQGWLELATTLRQPGMTLEAQGKAIRQWQYNWTGHPAAASLPSELALIAKLVQERPENITLALPLSGPLASAGAALRDGFMAAFYRDASARDYDLKLTVVDTHKKPFDQLYDELRKKNPDLIVGPLEKEALAAIANRDALPIPLLALNYLDGDTQAPARMYQFGLSAEDEARQIAERLDTDGLHQVMVLIPQGGWGDRFQQALTEALAHHDGVALKTERFFRTDNFRADTAELLGINTSRDRAIDVERTIGLNVEFEPRRRQDADAIVMVAQPTIARQFNPLFAFYYAGDLPVYSPSLVYEGSPDPSRDQDLDKVRFTDIPWILSDNDPLRSAALKAFPGLNGQLGRLFAMGADAYQLSTRLPLLDQVPDSTLKGQTGVLSMSEDGQIHRHQMWAQFQSGTPQLIPEQLAPDQKPGETLPETGIKE